jgi:hypothetical protein
MVVAFGIAATVSAGTLFHDNLDGADLDGAWMLEHPQNGAGDGPPVWVHADGVLSQTNPKPGDPTYAIIQGDNWPESYGVVAKVRLNEWVDHDRSRAGVGLWLDSADNYQGYTWLIHERLTETNMEFLNDGRAWFNAEETFDVALGEWYWVKASIDAGSGEISGKIWAASADEHDPSTGAEPDGWMSAFAYADFGGLRPPTSAAGLNGGAGTGDGFSTVSFDDVFVYDGDGPGVLSAVEAEGKVSTTWGDLKSR